jgi:hypothetical protein
MKLSSLVVISACCSLIGCNGETKEDPPPSKPTWHTVLEPPDLDRVALSVWGASKSEVFVVGGPLGNTPRTAMAMFYDGATWDDLNPGGDDTFWWVHGTSASDVWMVGENGRITHWNGSEFTPHTSNLTSTIWGVYAFSSNDVYAVSGSPNGGVMEPNDIVLHYDGNAWLPETLPGMPLGRSLFKVWGPSPTEIYVVGEQGTIWHKSGGTWTDETGATDKRLFTVWGCSADEVYAVGEGAVLLSNGDGNWALQAVDNNAHINGVSCAAPGEVVLAGDAGLKQRLVDGVWIDEFTERPFDGLHAAWAAGDGEFWVVGGDFIGKATPNAPRDGVVARYGVQ